MRDLLMKMDDVSRRQMMWRTAQAAFGVSMLPGFCRLAAAAEKQGRVGKAEHLIYIHLNGAMSHIDTFDPKPGTEVQGDTKVIDTQIAGVQFGEYMEKLAGMANQLAVVRGMNTSTGDHQGAQYVQQTGYRQIASIQHPGLGAWAHRMLGGMHDSLPATVQVGQVAGAGYLGAKFAPVPVPNPSAGLQNTTSPAYLSDSQFDQRIKLSNGFDSAFRQMAVKNTKVNGYDELYSGAISLLRSKDLEAFDISKEDAKVREAYGTGKVGSGALLARRLIQNGVRCVEVTFGSFDHHNDLWDRLPDMAREVDQALSALLTDLQQTGLLSKTVVAMGSEFGRKPNINQNAGRDHHPAAFTYLLAGAGIKGGQVFGQTDAEGYYVEDDGCTPAAFNATVAMCLGIDPKERIFSPSGRPFTIGNGEEPVSKLLA